MISLVIILSSLLMVSVMYILHLRKGKLKEASVISENTIFEYYFDKDKQNLVLNLRDLSFTKVELSKFVNVLNELNLEMSQEELPSE
ncbi:hypothetical protein HNW13_017920 [Shewanella sp. BF02_Schw]|uniref:hypothetical protein n=1 Tax=Shewanella sp. BF02_Schw TaxID=394908 RepID=UPI00177A92A1|nr:hypothetical protein [Shewanella sp. BF02_Schw]MBO1897617.1 hypothetical protein [Shewanella sp. BF02_Schw]